MDRIKVAVTGQSQVDQWAKATSQQIKSLAMAIAQEVTKLRKAGSKKEGAILDSAEEEDENNTTFNISVPFW